MCSMRVTVLYFAALRDLAGRTEEPIALPASVTSVGALADYLCAAYGWLAERRAHVRIARNEAFAEPGDELADGDVIALIPPVAGG
jgi:molybdopterin converting factor subunit 1